METAPSSTVIEVDRSSSPQIQKEIQSLAVLRAIGEVVEEAVQQNDSKARTLTEQLKHATDYDDFVELTPSILRHLYLHDLEAFVTATKALADGSRQESWRSLLGQTVLNFYLDLIAEAGDHAWTVDALRLIGNCCIDSDANRSRVLQKMDMASLFKRLESTEQQAGLAVGVLYNLCLDYEPAKQAARTHGLFQKILHMFQARLYTNTNLLGRLCDLLDLAVEDLNFETGPDDAISIIYDLIIAADPGFENRLSLCNSILVLLASERYQKLTIARSEVPLITTLFVFTYTQVTTTLKSPKYSSALQFDQYLEEPEQEEALSEVRAVLSARLWDLSARPEFALPDNLTTDLLCMLRRWLSGPQTPMQLCACSVFRNLTVSHGATSDLIRQTNVNDALVDIMRDSSDIQVLEETLRLYRNLAVHPDYKILLAENGAMDAITALWSKVPVLIVQYAAARVIRQLLTGENFNVKRFLALKPKQSEDSRAGNTYVARLMYLYSSTDDLGTRMEVGQIVVAMWRVGAYPEEETAAEPIVVDDAIHQAKAVGISIAKPVMAMITESGNPSLVTQGWLGLALMAGTEEGSVAVADIFCVAENLDVLRTTLLENGEESPTKDANNASILLRLLEKNHPGLPEQITRLSAMFSN